MYRIFLGLVALILSVAPIAADQVGSSPLTVGGGSRLVASKTFADLTGFDGGSAFAVTGVVNVIQVVGVVGTAIQSTSGTTTLQVGFAAGLGWFMSATVDNANFAAGDVMSTGYNSEPFGESTVASIYPINGTDITFSPDVDDLTQGAITLYVIWEPVSSGATVVAVP